MEDQLKSRSSREEIVLKRRDFSEREIDWVDIKDYEDKNRGLFNNNEQGQGIEEYLDVLS